LYIIRAEGLGLGLENKIETCMGPGCFLTSRMAHMYNGVQIHNLQIPQDTKKSRALLQKLSKSPFEIEKYPIIQRFLEALWRDVFTEAIFKGKTKYVLNNFDTHGSILWLQQTQPAQKYMQDPKFIQELIEAVKKEYEDCAVEYHETAGYDRKVIERVLVIDWS
jgi:hypothetical protein